MRKHLPTTGPRSESPVILRSAPALRPPPGGLFLCAMLACTSFLSNGGLEMQIVKENEDPERLEVALQSTHDGVLLVATSGNERVVLLHLREDGLVRRKGVPEDVGLPLGKDGRVQMGTDDPEDSKIEEEQNG